MRPSNTFFIEAGNALLDLINQGMKKNDGNQPHGAMLFELPEGLGIHELAMSHRHWAGHNQRGEENDHNAHAELMILRNRELANQLYQTWNCDTNQPRQGRPVYCLVTNVAPCPMCMMAAIHAKVFYTYYLLVPDPTDLRSKPDYIAEGYDKPRKGIRYVVERFKLETVDPELYTKLRKQAPLQPVPDPLAEFARETIDQLLKTLPVEKRMEGISIEDRLEGIPLKQRIQSIPIDKLIAAISPEARAELAQRLESNGSQPTKE
jgi:tRNA(Arg) A34 adenosine deaminase TadA